LFASPGFTGNFSDLTENQPRDGYEYASLLTALVAPISRGNVTISSPDTAVLPVINPNWLTSPVDQQVAVAAFKRARAFFAARGLEPILIGPEYNPGSSVCTDEQILQWIQDNMMTVWHASCTCAMGPESDPYAVVDSSARVIGVQNLRVVDASAFPILPPGHPQSTICKLKSSILLENICTKNR
jgi:choline dehydrogenase